jgi:hypothetical protein
MKTTPLPTFNAGKHLTAWLEIVYGQAQQVQITRHDKPLARLVSEPFMQAIDRLIAADPALADTLALMLNQAAQAAISRSRREYRAGQAVPVTEVLKQL